MTGPRTTPAGRLLNLGLRQLVRRGLRGIWVRGTLPRTAAVWAANHHSWWDGFVAGALLAEQGRPAALLMDADNLESFGFLRSIGVVPTQRPREALQALRDDRVLVIFPEGDLQASGPLGALSPGAGWFAGRAPAALLPVAVRIVNRGHQHPEAFVDIGSAVTPARLAPTLSAGLHRLDDALLAADPRVPLPGFDLAVAGRSSWDERISRVSARWQR